MRNNFRYAESGITEARRSCGSAPSKLVTSARFEKRSGRGREEDRDDGQPLGRARRITGIVTRDAFKLRVHGQQVGRDFCHAVQEANGGTESLPVLVRRECMRVLFPWWLRANRSNSPRRRRE